MCTKSTPSFKCTLVLDQTKKLEIAKIINGHLTSIAIDGTQVKTLKPITNISFKLCCSVARVFKLQDFYNILKATIWLLLMIAIKLRGFNYAELKDYFIVCLHFFNCLLNTTCKSEKQATVQNR